MIEDSQDFKKAAKLGLFLTPAYRLVKCTIGGNIVYISYTKKGRALVAHIAAERKSKRALRVAIDEAANAFFMVYDWCDVILAAVDKPSVLNLTDRCGFKRLGQTKVKNKVVTITGRFRDGRIN